MAKSRKMALKGNELFLEKKNGPEKRYRMCSGDRKQKNEGAGTLQYL